MRVARLFPLLGLLPLAACGNLLVDTRPGSRWHAAYVDNLLAAEDARDASAPALAQALEEEDPLLRRTALRAFGRIGDPAAIQMVFAATVVESDPANKVEGVFALGRIGHPAVLDAIEAFVTDPDPAVRAMALRALGMTRDERALLTLLAGMDDPEPQVRGEAALALERLMENRPDPKFGRPVTRFLPLAEAMRRDPDPGVRWRCAAAVGRIRDPELRSYLVDALNDEDPLVRTFACVGLAALPPREQERPLLLDATRDPSWLVVVEAVKAAGADPCAESFAALAELLAPPDGDDRGGHPSHHVRAAVAQALAGFAGAAEADACADLLLAALADPSESVRGAALESFAAVAPPDRVERLFEDVLFGRSITADAAGTAATPFLRAHVARAATKLPDERGYRLVALLVNDPDVPVRTAALAAMESFPAHAQESRVALQAALQEREVAVREAAARSAGALDLTDLRPRIEAALADSPGPAFIETRLALLQALAELGGREALPALRTGLSDPERAVRLAAREAIARLGGGIPEFPPLDPPERPAAPAAGRDFLLDGPPPRVRVESTRGTFVLEVLVDEAPVHAFLFLRRCGDGFYDGLTFHRMVPGFVVQGLDPRGDGYGTGDVSLRDEIGWPRYASGVVGMPNAGPDTGGCQLFVTFRPQPRLDARYTVFARVVEGMDVVERLDVSDRVETVSVLRP